MMLGAAIAVGVLALTDSLIATIINLLVREESPSDLDLNKLEIDQLQKTDSRWAYYQFAASIFYYQSLGLWAVLAVLLAIEIIGRIIG